MMLLKSQNKSTNKMTQNEALDILKTGANVFLTGEPGSGKTHIVNKFVQWLREHGVEPSVTASTGIAATHIGGMTIHSWSGIGIKTELSAEDLDYITQKEHVVRRIRKSHVLIIDEISMLSSNTFAMIDAVCREVRHDGRPFGGLQVVAVGDFFQLPPIVRSSFGNQPVQSGMLDEEEPQNVFAFSGDAWKRLNPIVCYLTEQHRQEDSDFLEVLSAIRNGTVSEKHKEILNKCSSEQGEDVPVLFPHNANVDRVNDIALSKLEGVEHKFVMEQVGTSALVSALVRGCLSPEVLLLKEGARVMFTKNNPNQGFANGTLGVVSGFDNGQPTIETYDGRNITAESMEWTVEDSGKIKAKIIQIPLRLAWAVTVHKSQGMSLDAAHIDLSRAFVYGQGYVALSRVRSLNGLTLAGINKRALEVHPDIQEKDIDFREQSKRAQETFVNIQEKELVAMHGRFLNASGGSVEVLDKVEQLSAKAKREDPTKATLTLLHEGKTIDEIASVRNRKPSTIITHLEKLYDEQHLTRKDVVHLMRGKKDNVEIIFSAFEKIGTNKLAPVFSSLNGEVSYDTLHLARIVFLLRNK